MLVSALLASLASRTHATADHFQHQSNPRWGSLGLVCRTVCLYASVNRSTSFQAIQAACNLFKNQAKWLWKLAEWSTVRFV